MKYCLAIPTLNGGGVWKESIESIKKYAPDGLDVLVIDSGSRDETAVLAEQAGFKVVSISSQEFNHGGTRNLAVELAPEDCEIVVFLTQDAIPEEGSLQRLVATFEDPKVACAYGRQLPHRDATPISRHARNFNYTAQNHVYTREDIPEVGLKTVFTSNSFAAYRISVFKELGGFPSNTILGEDMFYAGKAVLAGYKVAYEAEAIVRHSHNYTSVEEFKRYFDIGVFHGKETWIHDNFGGAGGEGKKFIFSELRFLLKHGVLYLPRACINNFMKIAGYKLGKNYKTLPFRWAQKLSMHKRYWK
ncbi:rhamnosyltransferase [Rouxiella silvae]|uniref:Glycosyltransferase family 2 protein n=1 Tax=Rouxiella silvae TaxID=1646373 RepID=A0AA41BXL1_9GAMM|nr:glycosyltransferase [Rouxiella silvae]KQN46537.1 rhamnosyltransferase [Serratia sp. Leaf50]MBF6638039.1 glycosyltransferase family 2 protein [Rouxiella silvae]ORJ20129.1 rhamnosyltransferase [Rouxiella silvae]